MRLFIRNSFLLHLFLVTFFCNAKEFIFMELDILVPENRKSTLWDVGPSKMVGFFNPAHVPAHYFATLDKIAPQLPGAPTIIKDGLVLPRLVKEWLCNEKTSIETKNFVLSKFEEIHRNEGIATSLYEAIAQHMFTPERYAKVRQCDSSVAKVLKKIHQQRDAYGNRKYTIILHSNQNKEAAHALYAHPKVAETLCYCDRIFISGDLGVLKPQEEFWQIIVNECGITKGDHIINIDNELNYIKAFCTFFAHYNIQCLHYQSEGYFTKKLCRLGVPIK